MDNLSFMLPACTPDLGGAVSMLAELGGMVIVHDAAGCMENYIVYDEPRWFGMDSMIYSSSLVELDAVLGNDEPLISGAVKAAQSLNPAFIAIVGSPVPAVTGMDLSGIAAEIEFRSGIPGFALSCSGFKPYQQGAGAALKELVQRFAQPADPEPGSMNLLGATPLDFTPEQLAWTRNLLTDAGWNVRGTFCMGTSLEDIKGMARAQHNLVISEAGLPAAKWLKRKFGTPFTCCVPFTTEMAACSAQTDFRLSDPDATPHILIAGEPIFAQSLAFALKQAHGAAALTVSDTLSEAELTRHLSKHWDLVVADPLCQALCSPGTAFFAWPHPALSSHLYTPGSPVQLESLLHSDFDKLSAAAERSAL